ncbi:MAG TPA: biotin/lipoyl-containing protein [Candidatus Limnocylindrales bacterium]|jgi:glutaconyl-CoA/methylmalonyl-CoA decarboxylase subunit gamma|nr:biotin/lipoyl-containing protein [Candidatus Limnocylindrales bacterium]
MKVILSRGAADLEVTVEPEDSGYRVSLEGRAHRVDGLIGESMRVRIDGRPVEAWVSREGETFTVELGGREYHFRLRDPRAPKLARRRSEEDATRGELHAPMPGLVVQVLAHEGEEVEAGHPVVVIEAMKMQNALVAPIKGRVRAIPVKPGTAVESGQLLLAITPEES